MAIWVVGVNLSAIITVCKKVGSNLFWLRPNCILFDVVWDCIFETAYKGPIWRSLLDVWLLARMMAANMHFFSDRGSHVLRLYNSRETAHAIRRMFWPTNMQCLSPMLELVVAVNHDDFADTNESDDDALHDDMTCTTVASYITGGVYLRPQHLDGLFQYLTTVFATDLHSRNFLQLSKHSGVDFRASSGGG
ncbi:RNA polymerase II transcription factor B subunit 4 [Tanacetum coccineum]|uniref:General transcription and DNA repair factor IIH subunit TFB4 n=1 Tax=Tanacetum coccineum TaxID=301880 RepID=A0ABQ5CUD0_9ASTR